MRRMAAALILLALGHSPASLLVARAGATCAMCSKSCCCAPKRTAAAGNCRLARPCDSAAATDQFAPAGIGKPALLPLSREAGPVMDETLTPAPLLVVRWHPLPAPPDPPPRNLL